jgi:putative tricarboxylic transport membrane protein
MPLDRLDRWLGPGLIAFALVWLWLAFEYIPGARAPGEPGPRAFPIVLGAIMAGLGLLMTVSAFASAARGTGDERTEPATRRELVVVAATFGLLALYAFLMERIGFLAATPIAIVLVLRGILGVRRWGQTLALAAGVTVACWLVFVVLLKTPLPHGTWLWLL